MESKNLETKSLVGQYSVKQWNKLITKIKPDIEDISEALPDPGFQYIYCISVSGVFKYKKDNKFYRVKDIPMDIIEVTDVSNKTMSEVYNG